MNKALALSAVSVAIALAAGAAQAQEKVKIGFITDMSSLYADVEGKGGATAIQMAIDDFGGKVNGLPIELVRPTTRTRPTSPPRRRASGSTPTT